MTKRLIASFLILPLLILVVGCESSTAPVSPTNVKVDNSKDVPPPVAPVKGNKKVQQGVVKGVD